MSEGEDIENHAPGTSSEKTQRDYREAEWDAYMEIAPETTKCEHDEKTVCDQNTWKHTEWEKADWYKDELEKTDCDQKEWEDTGQQPSVLSAGSVG